MKKALAAEAFVRISIAIVAVVLFGYIVVQAYERLAFSAAEQNFKKLVESIRDLKDGEPTQHVFYLDKEGALMAFADSSTSAVMVNSPSGFWAGLKYQLARPALCPADRSCLCLCGGGFTYAALQPEQDGIPRAALSCTGKLICQKLPLELQQTYTQANFPDTGTNKYTFSGGFFINREDTASAPTYGAYTKGLGTLWLTRKGNNLLIGPEVRT